MAERQRCRWLLVVAVLACLGGCERKFCKEGGCDGWTKVTYAHPIQGPYELRISTGGLAVSTRCPQSLQGAQPVGAQQARLGCDEHSFEVAVVSSPDGATQYGSHAADADPIEFHVEVTPLAPGSAASVGDAQVQIVHTLQPNGPECSPTCRGREGRVTLTSRRQDP